MSRRNLQHKLNALVKIVSYSPRSAVFELDQKQGGGGRKYKIKIPESPKENPLLEDIVDSIETKNKVRFRGTYTEEPASYFAYLMAFLNFVFFIGPKSTLEVFKRYRYEGEISISERRKKTYYKIELSQVSNIIPTPYFRIEKSQHF